MSHFFVILSTTFFPIFFLLINPVSVLGTITVYKANPSQGNLQTEAVKKFQDEAIWYGVQERYKMSLKQVSVQFSDSRHCYTKIKPPPDDDNKWLLLVTADTLVCDYQRKYDIAQKSGYDGLILMQTESNSLTLAYLAKTFQNKIDGPHFLFPVLFVDYKFGEYLKGIDNTKDSYFVNIDQDKANTINPATKPQKPKPAHSFTRSTNANKHKTKGTTPDSIFDTFYGNIKQLLAVVPFLIAASPFLLAFWAHWKYGNNNPNAQPGNGNPRPNFHNRADPQANHRRRQRARTPSPPRAPSPPPPPPPRAEVQSPFEILGIARSWTEKQAQVRYRELCKQLHPDRARGRSAAEIERDENRLKGVNSAWKSLKEYYY